MRAFRLKKRNTRTNKVTNQRDYVEIEALQRYGRDCWSRYEWRDSVAELYEKIEGKWVLLSQEIALTLMGIQ